jgi:hypothetical protein
MAEYFYATVIYHSGEKVRIIHRGRYPSKATMGLLSRIGAFIEIGDPVEEEKEVAYRRAAEAHKRARRLGWYPQMDTQEAGDA